MASEAQGKPNPPGFEAPLAGKLPGRKSLKIQVSFPATSGPPNQVGFEALDPSNVVVPLVFKIDNRTRRTDAVFVLVFEIPASISHNLFWILHWCSYIISSLGCALRVDIHFVAIGDSWRRRRRRGERERWRGEREVVGREREEKMMGKDFFALELFPLWMTRVQFDQITLNFNGKVNRGTILANGVIGWVPLRSLCICGYQKLHSVIVWVPSWDFTLNLTLYKE